MAHITLSVPDEVYLEMKQHPEIKWSEIARQCIISKTQLLKNVVHGKDILARLPEKVRKTITETPREEWIRFYKGMKEKEWKKDYFL